jgi:copper resistance protein B
MGMRQGRCNPFEWILLAVAILFANSALAQSDGEPRDWSLTVRQFEWQDSATPEAYMWDLQGWIGSERSRLWIRDEGGRHTSGARDDNRLELLWGSRPRWWGWMETLDLEMLVGVRYDSGTVPSRVYGALGFTGELPFGIRFEGTGYLGDGSKNGDDLHTGVRAQLERGWDLTDRWMVILRAEHEVWSEDHVRYAEGIGPWMWSAGMRAHYRINDHIAPYLGIEWFDLVQDTADQAEAAGEEENEVRAVVGLRFQFGDD